MLEAVRARWMGSIYHRRPAKYCVVEGSCDSTVSGSVTDYCVAWCNDSRSLASASCLAGRLYYSYRYLTVIVVICSF